MVECLSGKSGQTEHINLDQSEHLNQDYKNHNIKVKGLVYYEYKQIVHIKLEEGARFDINIQPRAQKPKSLIHNIDL